MKPPKKNQPPRNGAAGPSNIIEPTQDEIAQAAYFIWESEGRPPDQDFDNWRRAETQLRQARGLAVNGKVAP